MAYNVGGNADKSPLDILPRNQQISRSKGSVLGASTVNGGNTQVKQNGGWYNGVQYWAPGQGPQSTTDNGGDGGGGDGLDAEFEKQLNEAYDTSMGAINMAGSNAQSGYDADKLNLENRVANSLKDVDVEQGNLMGQTDKEQLTFNQVLRSALSDAIRSFNALNQQGRSRFGAGSSAGQAVGEIAQQEYFRQQGQVQQKGVEGTAQFADERAKIGQFVMQKKRDLDQYKQEALTTLTKNLKDTLATIEARKGDLAANKANAKMAALMEARGKAEQIATADKEFRQNLFLAAVNQEQQISGRAFTPAEIKARYEEYTSTLPDNVGAGPVQGGGTATVANAYTRKTGGGSDEIAALASASNPKSITQPDRGYEPWYDPKPSPRTAVPGKYIA